MLAATLPRTSLLQGVGNIALVGLSRGNHTIVVLAVNTDHRIASAELQVIATVPPLPAPVPPSNLRIVVTANGQVLLDTREPVTMHIAVTPDETATALTAVHRAGQTTITGTWPADAGPDATVAIRRSRTPFTSSTDGTLVTTLARDAYRLRYNDATILNGENLTAGLVLTDLGPRLTPSQFGVVATTPAGGGPFYYAAFVSSAPTAVVAGANVTGPVAETYRPAPGAILLGTSVVGTRTVRRYLAFENVETWPARGYYGFRFNVSYPTGATGPQPLYLVLHGAPDGGYKEPVLGFTGSDAFGVVITPVDNDLSGGDAYTPRWSPTAWLGYYDAAAGKWRLQGGVARLTRLVQIVRDNAIGDGFDFNVDANRVIVDGASMGSLSAHLAARYPELFTAAAVHIGFVDNSHARFPNGTALVEDTGLTLNQWLDLPAQAASKRLPPMVHQISAADSTLNPDHYDELIRALEAAHQAYYAEWMNTNHVQQWVTPIQWQPAAGTGALRFRKNVPYPAFGNASTSDAIPNFPAAAAGKRNHTFDWQSVDRTIPGGSPIVDTTDAFGISLISTAAATADTTICNTQQFHPPASAQVAWLTDDGQSGTVARNSDGTFTARPVYPANRALRLSLMVVQ